jgi:hypothetical protein
LTSENDITAGKLTCWLVLRAVVRSSESILPVERAAPHPLGQVGKYRADERACKPDTAVTSDVFVL